MKTDKTNSSKRFSAIFLLLAVCLLVGILPSVSALELSAVSLEKVGVDWDNVDSFYKKQKTHLFMVNMK